MVQKYLTVVVLVVVVVVDVEVIVVGSSETIVRDKILSQGMFTTIVSIKLLGLSSHSVSF